nr:immunoglobulin light chain junction region [Macaca mulatta]
CQQGYNAPPTF